MNENYNLTADQYADAFADFFAENEATYGDNVEEAYADFEDSLQSEIDADQFANYYADTQDIYGDNIEEAYADFVSFQNEELESEEEVEEDEDEDQEDEFSDEDLEFLEFYSDEEVQDIYGDNVEEAYADFMDAKAEEAEEVYSDKKQKRNQVVAATAIGGLYGASTGAAAKIAHNRAKNNGILKKRIKELQAKGVAHLTAAEHAELDDAKAKSRIFFPRYNADNYKGAGKAALIGGGTGAAIGGGAAALHNYSAEDFDNDFMDFYSEAEELYEGDIEEAFSDFEELMEEEYGVKDVVSKIGGAVKKAAGKVSAAGGKAFDKTQKFINKHIAEPGAAGYAVHHGASYSDEAEETEEEVYSDELTMDEFSEGFAEFYSENEDIYDDSDEALEEAYDDYADLIADEELEFMFSAEDEDEEGDREYGALDKAKGFAGNKYVKGAGIGAATGLAAGLIAGSVGKDAKERRALKAKGAGRTAEETARYNELKKSRRNKIVGGAVAGGAVGAGAGYASDKTGLTTAMETGVKRAKRNIRKSEITKEGVFKKAGGAIKGFVGGTRDKFKIQQRESVASAEDTKVEGTEDRSFSAIDLIGRPGQTSISMDKTFSMKSTKSDKTEGNSMIRGILGI